MNGIVAFFLGISSGIQGALSWDFKRYSGPEAKTGPEWYCAPPEWY